MELLLPGLGRALRPIRFTEDQKLSLERVILRYLVDMEIDLSRRQLE